MIKVNHLLKPIVSLRNITERIDMKKGHTKNNVTARARDNLDNEKKYKEKPIKNIKPLKMVKTG
jgi:hypothetical protein